MDLPETATTVRTLALAELLRLSGPVPSPGPIDTAPP
jgi:hypothetical protein